MYQPIKDAIGANILIKNHKAFVGMHRHSVEQCHAGLKLDKILSNKVCHQFLSVIGKAFVKKFGYLPSPLHNTAFIKNNYNKAEPGIWKYSQNPSFVWLLCGKFQ